MDKIILAVMAKDIESILNEILSNNGFLKISSENEYLKLLKSSLSKRRGDLEEDPSFKQIIPYLVLKYNNTILYYIRALGISEKRLLNKVAIGIGGHIEIEDIQAPEETVKRALKREVSEELGLEVEIDSLKPIGYIYTEISPVDTVHLGIVFTVEVMDDSIEIEEEELSEAHFIGFNELKTRIEKGEFDAENWTRVLLNNFDKF